MALSPKRTGIFGESVMGVEHVAGSRVASEGVNEVPERNLMPRRAGSPATHRSGLLRRCLPASPLSTAGGWTRQLSPELCKELP